MIDPQRFAPTTEPQQGGYVYSEDLVRAIRVALATERPLLLRGSPGNGKTSMAKDFAINLRAATNHDNVTGADFYQEVVTSRTEARDLEWRFDAVLRLAESGIKELADRVKNPANYIEPRALWWGFDPQSARAATTSDSPTFAAMPGRPAVVLIDEIDKAEPEVANDLLEPFDVQSFRVAESGFTVTRKRDVFLVVTTNDERDLPAAFLRRCVVHELQRPGTAVLEKIAKSHFSKELETTDEGQRLLLAGITTMIARIETLSNEANINNLREPGIAEFLDALRAIHRLKPEQQLIGEAAKTEWDAVTRLAMWKHPSPKGNKRPGGTSAGTKAS